jgi:FeS assembly SUF system regulator
MLRLSKFADYGVVVMTAAARAAPAAISAGEVSARTGVPMPTVAKLMSAYARAGLLASRRGVAGGAALARPANAVSLLDMIEVVDGPVGMTSCTHGGGDCQLEGHCAPRPHWDVVNTAVRDALARVTLADMMGAPGEAPARTFKTDAPSGATKSDAPSGAMEIA